jgi:hypothetical protein
MLIMSYILIVTVLLYICFKSRIKLPLIVDCICIAIVIWFGIVLYYAPNHYRGWPVSIYPPEMSFVKDSMIVEPAQDDPGAIYVWAITFTKPDGKRIYSPKDFLSDIKPGVPRVYKLPYSKEEQKKAAKKKGKGQLLFFKNKKDGFKLIDFQEILPKEGDE